jgi:hypothetical protein
MLHLLVLILIVSAIVRLITLPFRFGYRRRYFGYGYGDRFYNPYRYGCRRRHGIIGSFLPILALVALDRIFTRRF